MVVNGIKDKFLIEMLSQQVTGISPILDNESPPATRASVQVKTLANNNYANRYTETLCNINIF